MVARAVGASFMKAAAPAIFWLSAVALLASWELSLWLPNYLRYWLLLNLGASFWLARFFTRPELGRGAARGDQLAFVVFNVSFFYWLLWLDFAWAKYALPWLLGLVLFYLLGGFLQNRPERRLPLRLVFFLGGTFFCASAAFGLLTVLGLPLWLALLLFLAAFAGLSWPVIFYWSGPPPALLAGYLAMLLLAAETFSVLIWLPFTEVTLGLMLVIVVLAVYDLLKYFIAPALFVRRLVVKKIIIYGVFLMLILASTPWL